MDFQVRLNFLAPFRGVRYHIQNFHGQGHHLENANESFNLHLTSLRNTIEILFEILKSQFAINTTPPFHITHKRS